MWCKGIWCYTMWQLFFLLHDNPSCDFRMVYDTRRDFCSMARKPAGLLLWNRAGVGPPAGPLRAVQMRERVWKTERRNLSKQKRLFSMETTASLTLGPVNLTTPGFYAPRYHGLTDLSGIRPGYRLVRGQRGEERVGELGHEHIHVEDGIHLHGRGRVAAPAVGAAGARRRLVILVQGYTKDVGMHFAKKRELLLGPLGEGRGKKNTRKSAGQVSGHTRLVQDRYMELTWRALDTASFSCAAVKTRRGAKVRDHTGNLGFISLNTGNEPEVPHCSISQARIIIIMISRS